jgi:hypothetical protein
MPQLEAAEIAMSAAMSTVRINASDNARARKNRPLNFTLDRGQISSRPPLKQLAVQRAQKEGARAREPIGGSKLMGQAGFCVSRNKR